MDTREHEHLSASESELLSRLRDLVPGVDWNVRHYDPHFRKSFPLSRWEPDSAWFSLESLTHDYEVFVESWPSDSGETKYSVELKARPSSVLTLGISSRELRTYLDAGRRAADILELLERSLR